MVAAELSLVSEQKEKEEIEIKIIKIKLGNDLKEIKRHNAFNEKPDFFNKKLRNLM
ncbi:MAG: hypothetical protein MH321_05825 [Leptospiraceae bacterium]|nr:hypothetical protein [Leptospiraceae bacterium]